MAQSPTMYEPIVDGAFEDTVVFKWKRVPGATNYTLQVSTDSMFTSLVVDQTTPLNTYTWASGGLQSLYFWRVRFDNNSWSAKRRFSIINIAALPGLVYRMDPAKNITLDNGLVSDWVSTNIPALTMSQISHGIRPSFIANGLNNHPVIQYGKTGAPGSYTTLTYPTVNLPGGNFSFFTAYHQLSNTIGAQYLVAGNIRGLISGGSFGAGYNATIYDGSVLYQSTPTVAYLSWNVINYRKTGIRRNRSSLSMIGTPPNTFSLTRVGVDAGTLANFFHGRIGEMILTNSVLSDSLSLKVEEYLTAKYSRVVTLPPDTEACNTSLTVSIGPATDYQSIQWSNGLVNVSTLNITSNGTYWVRGTSWFGIQTTDTFTVSGLRPKPIINIQGNQLLCKNQDTLTFFVTNPIVGQQYSWSTGEVSDTIRVTDADLIYLIQTDPQSSCSFYSDTVYLQNKVKADFANPAACPGTDAQLLNLSVDFDGDTLVSHFWNFGDPSTFLDVSTDSNGVWNYAQSGTYPVFYRVTSSDGCADSITKNLLIKPSATPNFTWQGLCYGKPTQFFDQSVPENGTQVTGYQWNFGPGINSSFVNPALSFDTAGTYPVSLTVYTVSGCNETLVQQVPVNKGAIADFSIDDSLCAGQAVNALDLSTGVNDALTGWVWRFGSNPPILGQNPSFAFQNTGVRVVRLTVTTAAGCTDSIQTNVFVKPSPTANFSLAQQGGNPPFLPTVNNLSTGADTYLWSSGNFSDMGFEPAFPVFSDTGSFAITLVALNEEGCSDTVSRNIIVFTGNRSLELFDATCTRNGDFMEYTARILNKGALDVSDIRLEANTGYNEVVQETWTGSLTPGQILNYSFVSSTKLFTQDEFCCVRIKSFNDSLLVSAPDDEICLPLSNEVWFSNAYPQPVTGVFSLDYTLPFPGKISASMNDLAGKTVIVLWDEQTVQAGFGSLKADISDLKSGIYIIRISYRDKTYSVKLVKR